MAVMLQWVTSKTYQTLFLEETLLLHLILINYWNHDKCSVASYRLDKNLV